MAAEPVEVTDPYASYEVKAGFTVLQADYATAEPPLRDYLECRLKVAAFAGHAPATRALKAAGVKPLSVPRGGERWFLELSKLGRIAQLRACLVGVLHVLPRWSCDDAAPHVAARCVLDWFAASEVRAKPRRLRTGLDAWLKTPEGRLELACHEASVACEEAAQDPPGGSLEEQFGNRCVAEAAGRLARSVWAHSQGLASDHASTLREAFSWASQPLAPGTGKGESRAAQLNADSRLALAALRTAVMPGLLAFALDPSLGRA